LSGCSHNFTIPRLEGAVKVNQGVAIIIAALIGAGASIAVALISKEHATTGLLVGAATIVIGAATVIAVRIKAPKPIQQPSKRFRAFSLIVAGLSGIIVGPAVVGVFVYIPFVSDYAFWFAVVAYIMALSLIIL
jgi:hypothetical protein